MPPLPLQLHPITTDQSFTAGDVVVAAGAAIASGVLLQADEGCRIWVGAGVCLGLGCVIHASGGDIRIAEGANLGAGVLVVGTCDVGDRAIIGAGSTILSQSVPADALLPAATLWLNPTAQNQTPTAPPPPQTSPPAAPQSEPSPAHPTAAPLEMPLHYFAKNANRGVPAVETSVPQVSTFVDPTTDPEPVAPFTPPNFGTPTTPQSNFVYPDSNALPKNPWDDIPPVPPPPPGMFGNDGFGNNGFGTQVSPLPDPPQNGRSPQSGNAHWDSDLSPEETQHSDPAPPAPESALAPKNLRPVYGQAYVNQILGKMNGR